MVPGADAGDRPARAGRPDARSAIETTVTGLGYELVDVERAANGLLRVTIDRVPGRAYPSGESEFITVDDCELVTRQLQYVLEVDAVAYERLEVSSPGLDRPLKTEAHFVRFLGEQVSVQLKQPFQGRKSYKGLLGRADAGFTLVFDDGQGEQVLGFTLAEVRDAHLVPVINFKGRNHKPAEPARPAKGRGAGQAAGAAGGAGDKKAARAKGARAGSKADAADAAAQDGGQDR